MGEYIKHNGEEIKIGTCESLYYTTYQQFKTAFDNGELSDCYGNGEPSEYLDGSFRFRFPFPDEKDIKMGYFEDFDRGVIFKVPKTLRIDIGHDKQFHRVNNKAGDIGYELPCIQSTEFPVKKFDWSNTADFTIFEVIQQKPVETETGLELQTVVRCPYCKTMCRLSYEEILCLHIWIDENGKQFDDLQKGIVKCAVEGYKGLTLSEPEPPKKSHFELKNGVSRFEFYPAAKELKGYDLKDTNNYPMCYNKGKRNLQTAWDILVKEWNDTTTMNHAMSLITHVCNMKSFCGMD